MLDNYLRIALRNLFTHRLHSAINVVGLAVGLACCIMIALFVRHELSYDQQWENGDRIYRVSRDFFPSDGGPALYLAANAPQVVPLFLNDFPDVIEAGARVFGSRVLVSIDELSFYEPRFRMADAAIFEVFDFDWIAGNPETALAEPFTVVLTESTARKYFGDQDPMGQTLTVENQLPAKVTGIIRDLPVDTHLKLDFIGSIETLPQAFGESFLENWGSNNFHSYFLLREGHAIEELESQFEAFLERHFREGSTEWTGFTAFAVSDIYLRSGREFDFTPEGSMTTVYTFSAIAAFILLIACINFMNLSTARSGQRAREVGMRKVIGATRGQIVAQFLGESIALALVSTLAAVALVEISITGFNTLINRELSFNYVSDPSLAAGLLGLAIFVGVVAGSYPAFYLSAFRPARVLRGDVTRGASGALLRQVLVVTQFSISIALVIATAVVYSQMRFAQNIELGYDKDQVVVLSGSPTGGLTPQWPAMRERLLSHPGVAAVTASNLVPGDQNTNSFGVRVEGGDPEGRGMPYLAVDFGFFETFGIELLAGRSFSREFGTDKLTIPTEEQPQTSAGFILNRLAARQLGWSPEEALGKWFEVGMARDFSQGMRGPIVGVVEDVYFESVRETREPLVYFIAPDLWRGFPMLRQASIRVSGEDLEGTLAHIDAVWKEFAPDQPLTRRFLDTTFDALYADEERQAKMFTGFAGLAIFIACLGLFGLASFTTERRTKEIGIRKVLGGSVWDIVVLLSTEFSGLVLIANLVAWPLAWYFMRDWLANFAYRIDMTPWMFVLSGVLALGIAWITVGALAARAAMARPVLALRYE